MSQENILPYPDDFFSEDEDFTSKESFDTKLVYNYPSAEKKVQINIHRIDMKKSTKNSFAKVFTTFISPHGLEFKGSAELKTGTLLKIDVMEFSFFFLGTSMSLSQMHARHQKKLCF